jgi:hypothetical protein
MNMNTCIQTPGKFCSTFKTGIAESEAGVQTDHGSDIRFCVELQASDKIGIFFKPGVTALDTVAIGYLVAKVAAQTAFSEGITQNRQRTANEIGAGMVVNQGGYAVANGIEKRNQGCQIKVFFGKCLVKAPPETLENLDKIGGRSIFQSYAARKSRVKVHVRINDAGHYNAAFDILYFGLGKTLLELFGCADGMNFFVVVSNSAVIDDAVIFAQGNYSSVTDNFHQSTSFSCFCCLSLSEALKNYHNPSIIGNNINPLFFA